MNQFLHCYYYKESLSNGTFPNSDLPIITYSAQTLKQTFQDFSKYTPTTLVPVKIVANSYGNKLWHLTRETCVPISMSHATQPVLISWTSLLSTCCNHLLLFVNNTSIQIHQPKLPQTMHTISYQVHNDGEGLNNFHFPPVTQLNL